MSERVTEVRTQGGGDTGDQDYVIVKNLWPDARPSWSDVTSAGIFRVEPNGRFDLHYHDCDEYWLIFAGRARVTVGSGTYEVEPGDIVCTPTGNCRWPGRSCCGSSR